MKTIHLLLHSAAAISIVPGNDIEGPHGNTIDKDARALRHDNRNKRRILQEQNNDNDNDSESSTENNATTCNLSAGETPCHDEVGHITSCARPDEDCPCRPYELRCPADPARFFGGSYSYYCDTVCCEWGTQERCHAPSTEGTMYYDVWCANVDEGGCPCPAGEGKCGVFEVDGGHTGYCTPLCCDNDDNRDEGRLQEQQRQRQTCYDENYDPSYCAYVDEGGCPCPEGQIKCGGTEDWAGYCTEACCDHDEEACYDSRGNKSCDKILEGGCSLDTSYKYWESRVASTILSKGTGSQVSYYASIKGRKKQLLVAEDVDGASIDIRKLIKYAEEEEAALFHAIRLGKEKKNAAKIEEVTMVTSIS